MPWRLCLHRWTIDKVEHFPAPISAALETGRRFEGEFGPEMFEPSALVYRTCAKCGTEDVFRT